MSGFFGGALGGLGGLAGLIEGSRQKAVAGGLLSEALASAGGVAGLVGLCEQAGLAAHVRSWIGTGSNLGITVEEITRVFPPEQIDAWAQQHGVPSGVASQLLAQFLPHAVDAATPGGTLPAGAAAQTAPNIDFASLIDGLLGHRTA